MFVSRKLLALAAPSLFVGLSGVLVVAPVTSTTGLSVVAAEGGSVLCIPPGNPGDYAVSVTPDDSALFKEPFTAGHTSTFTVTNTGNCQDTYTFSAPPSSGPITGITLDKSGALLTRGSSTTVIATHIVTGSGTGTLSMWATGQEGGASDMGSFTVSGPPSNWDAAPLNQNHQALARCGAGCFAATHAQSTVPYISLDALRNVTLVYHGDRVWPKPFIHLNVQKPSGTIPDTVFLEVKKAGTFQTFANGENRLKFAAASAGWQRIGGQLRDSTWATGMHAVEIIVTWK